MEAHTILPPISLSHTKLSHLNLLPSLEDTHGKNTRFPYIYIRSLYIHSLFPFLDLKKKGRSRFSNRSFPILFEASSSKGRPTAEEGEGRFIAPRDDICLRLLPLPSDRRSTISERGGRGKRGKRREIFQAEG